MVLPPCSWQAALDPAHSHIASDFCHIANTPLIRLLWHVAWSTLQCGRRVAGWNRRPKKRKKSSLIAKPSLGNLSCRGQGYRNQKLAAQRFLAGSSDQLQSKPFNPVLQIAGKVQGRDKCAVEKAVWNGEVTELRLRSKKLRPLVAVLDGKPLLKLRSSGQTCAKCLMLCSQRPWTGSQLETRDSAGTRVVCRLTSRNANCVRPWTTTTCTAA